MSITLALGHDQRVATVVTLIAVAVVAAGIVIWRRQYRNPPILRRTTHAERQLPTTQQPAPSRTRLITRPPATHAVTGRALGERERGGSPISPGEHRRRDPQTDVSNEEMSHLARFILAHYGLGGISFAYPSNAYGVANRDFARFTTDFANLLNCTRIVEAKGDDESVNGYCDLLKHSAQFEEFLLTYARKMYDLYADYDTNLDRSTRREFGLFEPSAWTFDYLLVAAASREPADQVAEGVKASDLVLIVNFLLALNGYGQLGLIEKYAEVVEADDYIRFIQELNLIVEVDRFRTEPDKLVPHLLQVSRDKALLQLLVQYSTFAMKARAQFWDVCESSAQFSQLIPFVPDTWIFEALMRLNEQVAETK